MNDERPRAVFSQNDYSLIKEAIISYIQDRKNRENDVEFEKLAAMTKLYHRLGRIS